MLRTTLIACALILPAVAGATEYRIVERPRQECWNEQVPVQAARRDAGGAIIGGIAGGLLGNQIGGGNGRVVATAVGAMTGAVVGDRMSGGVQQAGYDTVRRCRTVTEQVREPIVYQEPVIYRQPVMVEERVVVRRPVVVRPTIVEERFVRVDEYEDVHYRGRGHWKHKHWKHHHDED